jgi:hypothetical protein
LTWQLLLHQVSVLEFIELCLLGKNPLILAFRDLPGGIEAIGDPYVCPSRGSNGVGKVSVRQHFKLQQICMCLAVMSTSHRKYETNLDVIVQLLSSKLFKNQPALHRVSSKFRRYKLTRNHLTQYTKLVLQRRLADHARHEECKSLKLLITQGNILWATERKAESEKRKVCKPAHHLCIFRKEYCALTSSTQSADHLRATKTQDDPWTSFSSLCDCRFESPSQTSGST